MSREFAETTYDQIQGVVTCLQSPVEDLTTLLGLLASPLDALKLLPPKFVRHNAFPLPPHGVNVPRHIPLLQRALLEHVLPVWGPTLDEERCYEIAQQYFAPDIFMMSLPVSKSIAVYAYDSILALSLTEHSVRMLTALAGTYPVDVLWASVFSSAKQESYDKAVITWEDCVRNIAAVPGRVANALASKTTAIPPQLEAGPYFNSISTRSEILIASLPSRPSQDELSSVVYLLTKLVNVGHLLGSVPSALTLQSILTSLFAHLSTVDDLADSPRVRALVKREAALLKALLGRFNKDSDIVDGFVATALGRHWSVGQSRIFTCWISGARRGEVLDVWIAPDHVRHSLLSGHQYYTSLLLLTVSYLSTSKSGGNSVITTLALSPPFVKGVSLYISHLDPSVRRCGMLVAEEVARASGKTLDFGDWEGDADGREWCRKLRALIRQRDSDADDELVASLDEPSNLPKTEEAAASATKTAGSPAQKPAIETTSSGYDSDDSLTGYASEPSSSRSPSPTPSELEEYEKDPTLRVTQSNVARPVYLAQLGEMVRPTRGVNANEDQDEPKRIQVALDVAEELIRRKRDYGTELDENAVNLVYGFVALNDNFNLDGFNEKRQAALTALVACCPRKAAPAIIESFFKNQYTIDHRFVMLNALALGARELASLPVPPPKTQPMRVAFPSKRLPPALHQRYLTLGDQLSSSDPVQNLLEGISQKAIESGRASAEDKVPEYARERQLRVKRPSKVSEVPPTAPSKGLESMQLRPRPAVQFTEVAAEHFVGPMVAHFWAFLRDEQTREARTAHQGAVHRYRGAGVGLVLSALVLAQFVATLAVVVHAARNAKEWPAVLAPDALELAVTVGTRPVSAAEGRDDSDDEDGPAGGQTRKEAALLSTAMELAVVVIDGSLERDGGRSLGLEHTALVLAAGEWGAEVLSRLEKGTRVLGEGGVQEMKLRRAAAGLVLKVDELTSRWRPSMVNTGF
ncbi:hypothetical protein PHLGIDRAFT_25407 [Phlebiopsis gigantea 11061_1 CR5-6]|uniref:Telomere length regulation protein conserved domain-containing protein n=1 Tax=Phlebiopsis gigantea (strain 11061_1 CR5-6) TaxID=745531 RepID=A0A0C3NIS4_PHLG1|nr:hypothetical protein PHLGIDRAFT_25407 [Phlebiopsis gigantea 11061_1 CR5-6]